MATCKTCQNPQVETVNALIASGTPIRQLARMTAIPRSSLARHAGHVPPSDRPLGLVPAPTGDPVRVDPLFEAFALLGRAQTERERLKGLEQVRAATALRLRELGTPDEEALQLLDNNVAAAMTAYRESGESFEHAIRGLQGVRESIRAKLDAVKADETIETSYVVGFHEPGGHVVPGPAGKPFRMSLALYFADIPARFHHPHRYRVARTIHLGFPPDRGHQDLKVYEGDALVWAKTADREGMK